MSCGDTSCAGFTFDSDLVSALPSGFGSVLSVGLMSVLTSGFSSAFAVDGGTALTSGVGSTFAASVGSRRGLITTNHPALSRTRPNSLGAFTAGENLRLCLHICGCKTVARRGARTCALSDWVKTTVAPKKIGNNCQKVAGKCKILLISKLSRIQFAQILRAHKCCEKSNFEVAEILPAKLILRTNCLLTGN